jgi:hypothetical protein
MFLMRLNVINVHQEPALIIGWTLLTGPTVRLRVEMIQLRSVPPNVVHATSDSPLYRTEFILTHNLEALIVRQVLSHF